MELDHDEKMLREVLRAVEMYRREVRMRNKVELYRAILESEDKNLGWVDLARLVNDVYAEMYVLSKPRQGEDHGREARRSSDQ